MEIESIVHPNQVVQLIVKGRITYTETHLLRNWYSAHLEAGQVHYVADLRDVTFIDSSGLGEFINLLKRARFLGGNVRMILPTSPPAAQVLLLTRIDLVIRPITAEDINS